MTRTIAITGATGFAGRPAVAALIARGYRVRALVRDANRAALPQEVELIPGDLASGDSLRRLVDGVDAVLHLAGAISALDREGFFAVNRQGTANVVAAARLAGTARFVHVSSLAAREPALSPYGASKLAGEDVVKSCGGNAVILRPPAVYGPGDTATLPLIRELTRPLAMIPSTASARFSLIHVRDLARILADAVTGSHAGVIELSDGKPGGYSWADLCAIAAEHEGRIVRPVFLPRTLANVVAGASEGIAKFRGKPAMVSASKIAELYHPDWVARAPGWPLDGLTPFGQGLAETLAWYRQRGWLPPRRGPGTSTPRNNNETRS